LRNAVSISCFLAMPFLQFPDNYNTMQLYSSERHTHTGSGYMRFFVLGATRKTPLDYESGERPGTLGRRSINQKVLGTSTVHTPCVTRATKTKPAIWELLAQRDGLPFPPGEALMPRGGSTEPKCTSLMSGSFAQTPVSRSRKLPSHAEKDRRQCALRRVGVCVSARQTHFTLAEVGLIKGGGLIIGSCLWVPGWAVFSPRPFSITNI